MKLKCCTACINNNNIHNNNEKINNNNSDNQTKKWIQNMQTLHIQTTNEKKSQKFSITQT